MLEKIEIKKPKNVGEALTLLANVMAWAVMLAYFVALPLYFKNGYASLASNKYLFFMELSKYTLIVAGVVLLLRLCLWGFSKEEIMAYKGIKMLDLFVVSFGLISLISHWASAFRTNTQETYYLTDWFYEGSKWGTRGWFMGLMTYLIFIMLYFILSRCLIYNRFVFIPAVFTTTLICLWGVINRFGYAPIDMNYKYEEGIFLASIGNINWFCGFTAVLVPIIWGLYMGCKTKWLNVVYMVCISITFAMIIVNSSDSGYLALVVTLGVLFGYVLSDKGKMLKFLELLIDYFAVCSVIWIVEKTKIIGNRTAPAGLMEPFIGIPSLVILLVVIGIYIFLRMLRKEYPVKTMLIVRKVYIILACIGVGLLVLLIVINTLTDGALPVIGGSSLLLFDPSWGSGRGETWGLGIKTFGHLNFWHKLVGSGPDTMFYAMIGYEDLAQEWNEFYGSARLTNAHNEIITLLVNVGILGTAAFIGVISSAVGYSFKKAKEQPEFICFGLAVISYVSSNIFSFQQITNIPFLFLLLGLEGAALVSADKKAVLLTKKDKKHTIQKGKKSRK